MKRKSFIPFVILGLAVLAPPVRAQTCDPAPAGIVSWWSAEGNTLDNLGLNNGTFTGTPAYASGMVGQAFSFDGSSQYIRVPDSASLRLSNAMTLEAWVYPTAYNQQSSAVLCKYSAFAPANSSYTFGVNTDGRGVALVSTNGNVAAAITLSTNTAPLFSWTHLAAVYDGTNLIVYINGVADGSQPMTGNIYPGNYDLGIGANIGGNLASLFSGMIDEPAIYSRALSPDEILAIYNAGSAGKCPVPATIVTQPADVSVFTGQTATFTVTATGFQPVAYQWYFNGTNISDATNSILVLSNAQPSQAGPYYVTVSNPQTVTPIASSNASLAVLSPPPCVPAPSGIVSWWSGESNALDNIGGNNGIPVGSPTYTPGKDGLAFNFNGSQFFRVPDAPNLHLSNAMTAEAWVYPTAYNGSASQILCKYQAPQGTGSQPSWALFVETDGRGALIVTTNGGSSFTQIFSTNVCPLNIWTHLAATYDGSSLNMYFNGARQSNAPFTGNLSLSTYDLGIGANIGGVGNGSAASLFQGLIDEPAIYNRALSSNEIAAIYDADLSGKCLSPLAPSVSVVPPVLKAYAGANANFDAIVSGSPVLGYQWKSNSTIITGATNRTLAFTNVTVANAGNYALLVTNALNSALANAQLEVFLVSVLANNVLLTNPQYTFSNSVTIKLTNYFATGPIFYTLDGSTPTAGSTLYSGTFTLVSNAVIRALGYSPDFQQSAITDPITVIFPPAYTFSATVAGGGGGSVSVSPAGSTFVSNTVVTVTATPSNGWTFLGWTGDVGGNGLSNTLIIDRNKSVQAIFGTSVNTTVGGSGSVALNPPGGVYPFGTALQASAIPQSGNFFVLWGSAASGNVNPLTFSVTNTNSTISALFAPLSGGQVALTVVPVGPGTVAVNPPANTYSTGESVTVTATPASNHAFVGWSGSASGTNNPLNVQLNQSETIYANFSTNKNSLLVYPVTPPGTGDGIAIDLIGQLGAHYSLDVSSSLLAWSNLYNLTNYVGTIHYIDSSASNANHRFYRAETIVP